MVIDASAIVAICFGEPEGAAFNASVADDPVRLASAATIFETALVVEAALGEAGGRELDQWLAAAGVEIVPVDAAQIVVARDAWRRFGKGRHAAGLNFGDCFSYALAAVRREPLLFKGRDFILTDIAAARY